MNNSNIEKILHILRCPATGSRLSIDVDALVSEGDQRIRYPIINGIIDFVGSRSDYDQHWNEFSELPTSSTKLAQAKDFIDWINCSAGDLKDVDIILDVGCGDGNHLPFFPVNSTVIALDYSDSVYVVKKRYSNMENLIVLRADAMHLPVADKSVGLIVSYSCFNHLPEPKLGMLEVMRVLKEDAYAAIWGYGTNSSFIFYGFRAAKLVAKVFRRVGMESILIYALIPLLRWLPSATRIRPGRNSMKECKEIISTNLAPEYVHILFKWTWDDLKVDGLKLVSNYKQQCGQLFRKADSGEINVQ